MKKAILPQAFVNRRLHSLAGLALVIFLIFHLFTNSQAALWVGNDGQSYIHSVNALRDIPYLQLVELLLLALPLAIHALLGVKYLFTGENNVFANTGKDPYLPEYGRNHAYTWQRITSWILLAGILAHVVHMRFVEQPVLHDKHYLVALTQDPGLDAVAKRLGVTLQAQVNGTLEARASDFGTAELLMVREAFKSPLIMVLYTILVLAACFHAFNGLWTFMISWGVTLSVRIQALFLKFATFLMFVTLFLGLATIYLTYWVNLRG